MGRRIVKIHGKQIFFSQGEAADFIFYPQSGRAILTVVSSNGKKATITLLVALPASDTSNAVRSSSRKE
jgi:CRP-like cAMP-binding protein